MLVVLLSQVVQYAALLGPWPTQVPDDSMQPTGALAGLRLHVLQPQPRPPAPPQHTLSTARLSHAGFNSTSSLAATDLSELYHGLLHPPGMRAAAALNASRTPTIAVVYSQPSQQSTQPGSSSSQLDDADAPTGQLLLWYFLGLAAVQPLVLWLQAAALAVVLNVLRHLPEQQLQLLLGKSSAEPAGADASATGRGSSGQLAGGTGGRSSSSGWQRDSSSRWQRDRVGYDVFLPLSYDWRARWTWLDWLRFRLLKHSLDILLVSRDRQMHLRARL